MAEERVDTGVYVMVGFLGLWLMSGVLDRRRRWEDRHRVLSGVGVVLVLVSAYGLGWLGWLLP